MVFILGRLWQKARLDVDSTPPEATVTPPSSLLSSFSLRTAAECDEENYGFLLLRAVLPKQRDDVGLDAYHPVLLVERGLIRDSFSDRRIALLLDPSDVGFCHGLAANIVKTSSVCSAQTLDSA